MKKTTVLGITALLIVGLLSSVAVAYKGDYSLKGPDCTPERHDRIQQAIEQRDYIAWYGIMVEDGRMSKVTRVVTEQNFEVFAKAYEAGKAGDVEAAQELRAELGLNDGVGPKDGNGFQQARIQEKKLEHVNSMHAKGQQKARLHR